MVKLQTYFIDYQIHSLLLITSTLSTLGLTLKALKVIGDISIF